MWCVYYLLGILSYTAHIQYKHLLMEPTKDKKKWFICVKKLYVEMLSKDVTYWFIFVFIETMDLLM